jgi:hypothetical protein
VWKRMEGFFRARVIFNNNGFVNFEFDLSIDGVKTVQEKISALTLK